MINPRDEAERWLIKNNHHACHLVDGKTGPLPSREDVTSLAALLDEVQTVAWETGYDQAAREVLSELKAADKGAYMRCLAKFPKWRDLMKERAGGPW
jgi:hypothetical protein